MNKFLKFSLLGLSATFLFTGCMYKVEVDKYKVKEYNDNEVVVTYRSDKISTLYFQENINQYCIKRGKLASINYTKRLSEIEEEVSYSCILDK